MRFCFPCLVSPSLVQRCPLSSFVLLCNLLVSPVVSTHLLSCFCWFLQIFRLPLANCRTKVYGQCVRYVLFACPASGPPDTPRQKCWGVSFFCLALLYVPMVSSVPAQTFRFGLFAPFPLPHIRIETYGEIMILQKGSYLCRPQP